LCIIVNSNKSAVATTATVSGVAVCMSKIQFKINNSHSSLSIKAYNNGNINYIISIYIFDFMLDALLILPTATHIEHHHCWYPAAGAGVVIGFNLIQFYSLILFWSL